MHFWVEILWLTVQINEVLSNHFIFDNFLLNLRCVCAGSDWDGHSDVTVHVYRICLHRAEKNDPLL